MAPAVDWQLRVQAAQPQTKRLQEQPQPNTLINTVGEYQDLGGCGSSVWVGERGGKKE